uniref:Rieske domain-containing protein n=1 Tax=Skeletonema marinoi TaxID=267567 RepID=A0A7S2KAU2_9STRA|mmetsp:Transcript_26477/g.53148  ORF Transcript_26477/g.53148 Transcript_26477/m.53148 type:complete len:204 (+) Transcript_26477:97-708(+)|eukprot:CAMPEP_0113389582 /NCGR_PEP_ID=MMETSP0013_2-20120614/9703_1 /TAXON_ID=2843 ORGANISM="Skeletonema costatum, Strain 1716" /NCGR_SAMPLE_ID=MMETSP0013_2 /ASSEMBLY_ACC=CAM_ASM_000158 /LENGTH=203 /DNA_ID=CAMNT_0000272667 /DNA_START=28 /DNA_END=639 /DNA_ORIENTATION=- /assembly_acc=CAM_ASM_000158
MKLSSLVLLICAAAVSGFAPALQQQTSSALYMAKGRRGGLTGNGNSKLNKPKSIGGSDSDADSKPKSNWVQTSIPSIKSLPSEKNVVKLVDTQVPSLINKQTNPTGAVSIVNYEDKTYCFSSGCASCQIPLTKGKVLEPSDETNDEARLQCDFCGATYNLRTGAPVQKEGGKLFGFLFSKAEEKELPVYGLGEQGGKVFINVP